MALQHICSWNTNEWLCKGQSQLTLTKLSCLIKLLAQGQFDRQEKAHFMRLSSVSVECSAFSFCFKWISHWFNTEGLTCSNRLQVLPYISAMKTCIWVDGAVEMTEKWKRDHFFKKNPGLFSNTGNVRIFMLWLDWSGLNRERCHSEICF